MKNLFLLLLLFVSQVAFSSSNLSKSNVILGVGSLLLGVYLAKNTYNYNSLVPEAITKRDNLRNNLQQMEKQDTTQETYEEKMPNILSDYSVWYFETYKELPYTFKSVHTSNLEIIDFFQNQVNYDDKGKKRTAGAGQYARAIINAARQKTIPESCIFPSILLTFSIYLGRIELSKYLQK